MQKLFKIKIKPIKSALDYQDAMARMEIIFDSKSGSKLGDELKILEILIDNYENEHFSIGFPDSIEVIKFRTEQLNYDQSDLAKIIGLKSRASGILNRKRKLSLKMIRQLNSKLNIPTEVLIQV